MRLKFALEPEAASIWCQLVTTEAKGALSGSGTKYMVVDMGGGTADISVHEKAADGTLKSLHVASGGPWGGMYVDNNYMDWLGTLYGQCALEKLKKEDMADYFDILREFETKKRSVTSTATDQINFRIPAVLKEISEELGNPTLQEKMASLGLGMNVSVKRDKMRIDPSIVRSWFDEPVNNVIKHINSILAEPDLKQVNSILLVGGFGESKYVQEKMKTAVSAKRLIVPNEAELAVLKGAVRFGHNPNVVSARVMKYSYGIARMEDFDYTKYPVSAMTMYKGKKKVTNVFDIFVGAGDTILNGQEVSRECVPNTMNSSRICVFCSTDPKPEFTTESSCKLLGEFLVMHEEGNTLEDKAFDTILIFGDTELIVKVKMQKSGKDFFTTINCLH